MIEVRRIEHGSPVFEVVVREGKGATRHHVTMSRETCERLTAGKHNARALSRERDGDLALFPRVRAGDATLPFAVLTDESKAGGLPTCGMHRGTEVCANVPQAEAPARREERQL